MSRGLFLALEGPEGAGKSTQATRLASWLEARGRSVTRVREPGGTPVGEAIREHLWVRPELVIGAEAELFLVSAARASLVREVIGPALARGSDVVADRFDLSTLAYQGYGRGLDRARIREVTQLATGGLGPDLYLVLDVSAPTGEARQRAAGKAADRIEREGQGFLTRVREGYLALAEEEERAELLDGTQTLDEVEGAIQAALVRRLPQFGLLREVP